MGDTKQQLWIDANNKPALIGTGFDAGETACPTANMAVLLLPDGTETLSIVILADASNTTAINIGGSSLHPSSNPGLQLAIGASVSLDIDNSKQPIYIATATAADKVSWLLIKGKK
ncbi:hypothetical protein CMI37_05280 [Candidatus Pacearchaeota archaeon]|nr:hypothetical protein [Candidatus Pacearchaeota archaeon]